MTAGRTVVRYLRGSHQACDIDPLSLFAATVTIVIGGISSKHWTTLIVSMASIIDLDLCEQMLREVGVLHQKRFSDYR